MESSGYEEEEDPSFCPPVARMKGSSPALLEDICARCPLSGGVSSNDCQAQGDPIDSDG